MSDSEEEPSGRAGYYSEDDDDDAVIVRQRSISISLSLLCRTHSSSPDDPRLHYFHLF